MTACDHSLLRRALLRARLSPSAHNAQPARWGIAAGGRVLLLEDPARHLRAGDPTRRDHLLSLGAAFEGMHVALSESGWGLTPWTDPDDPDAARHAVAATTLRPTAASDPAAHAVEQRHTFRGQFAAPAIAQQRAVAAYVHANPDIAAVTTPAGLQSTGTCHDRSQLRVLRDPAVVRELRLWMRLTPPELRGALDGLTADALSLSHWGARAAACALRPRVFRALAACGIARELVSEGRAVRSATSVLVLHRAPGAPLLDAGRRLYRVWLELTALGFAACPMSALLDTDAGLASIRRLAAVPDGREPVAVLRVGPMPATRPDRSPRLPTEALLTTFTG